MTARRKGYKEMVDEALTHIVTLSVLALAAIVLLRMSKQDPAQA